MKGHSFIVGALILALVSLTACQPIQPVAANPTTEAPATAGDMAQVTVPGELVQLILDFAPGAWTPIHEHGGPMVVTVLEGEVTARSEDTGEETVYAAGEFWTEVPGQIHAAGNDTEENARVAVTVVLPEGGQLTIAHEGETSGELPPGPTMVSRTGMPVTVTAE